MKTVMMYMLLIMLVFGQCSSTHQRILNVEQIDSIYIDESIRKIIHQYIQVHPYIDNVGLFFDWENDIEIIKLYGDGTYFTIGAFDMRCMNSDDNNLSFHMPSSYFYIDKKCIYIVPAVNIIKSRTYGKSVYDKKTVRFAPLIEREKGKWLIKCEWDYSHLSCARKIMKLVRVL